MMQMDGLNRTSEHLIYLISCALRGAAANSGALKEIDLDALFVLAKSHSVSAMVCMALEKTAAFTNADPSAKAKWLDAKNKAIRKNLLLDSERVALMEELERAGIWHMPLKGSILKDWYPQYGMREMADNDILFDEAKRTQVKELFLKRGYTVESFHKGNHDVYMKPPVFNYEMHTSLFSSGEYEDLAGKYANVKDRLLPDEGRKFRYHFTQEDFYVFVVTHAYKHYSHGGTGIRTLADIYVMNQKIGQAMDWNYLEKELNSLGIQDYEKNSRELSGKIFSDKPLSEVQLTSKEQEMLRYYMGATTYGTVGNSVSNRLQSMQADGKPVTRLTKIKYCLGRLFPGRKWCKEPYPFFYRHPYLLPTLWVWRCVVKIPARWKKVRRELAALKDTKQS